ncbi:MAG: hydrogenase formation protein HypD [Candidatus Hadarchaeales archaeon]
MREVTKTAREIFREKEDLAKHVISLIKRHAREIGETIKIMNFCGTHEWTTVHYGIRSILPPNVEMVAGPGCPVCITPAGDVDLAVEAAMEGIILYTYGDAFRLRGSKNPFSLQEAKAAGADVRVVYSFLDAVRDAEAHGRESLFFGIGFETTAPSYAILFESGKVPRNLKFLSACRLTPPSMKYVVDFHEEKGLFPIKGVIAPGHVSTVIGASEWGFLPKEYGIPVVVAGFEPVDVLLAVERILRMISEEKPGIEVEYRRLVTWEGNVRAKRAIEKVFKVSGARWRGLGEIPKSGLVLREEFSEYEIAGRGSELVEKMPPGCRCADVIVGVAKPSDCPLFISKCSPTNPIGPCMVSSEGTCSIWAREGERRK